MRINNPFQRSVPAGRPAQTASAQNNGTAQLPRPDGLTSRMLRRSHSDEAVQSGLVHAVAGGNTAAAAHFQAAGADPNAPARDSLANVLPGSLVPPRGPTAMHVAAGAGMDGSQIRQLMSPGPGGGPQGNPNVRLPATRLHGTAGVRNDTPLHVAARAANPATTGELLAHPLTDVHALNARGQQPIDVARARLAASAPQSAEEEAARTVVDQLQTHGTGSGLQQTGVVHLDPPPYDDGRVSDAESAHSIVSFSALPVAGGQGTYQPTWMHNTEAGSAGVMPQHPEDFEGAHDHVFGHEDPAYAPGRALEEPRPGSQGPSPR